MLTDQSFRPLARMSMASSSEAVAKAQPVRRPLPPILYIRIILTARQVSVVPLRYHPWSFGEHGDPVYGLGGELGAPSSYISDQNYYRKIVKTCFHEECPNPRVTTRLHAMIRSSETGSYLKVYMLLHWYHHLIIIDCKANHYAIGAMGGLDRGCDIAIAYLASVGY